MTVEKMNELVLRYRVPASCICKIPTVSKYVSTLSPLKISVYKESFRAKSNVLIYPFIKGHLDRYGHSDSS